MPYRLQPRPGLFKDIADRWQLSDSVFVELHQALERLRREQPSNLLERTRSSHDGMVYAIPIADLENPGREYLFTFYVRYLADEETLLLLGVERLVRDIL